MKSKASIGGHPLHPIFVTIPIGLWSFSPVCDLIYHAGWGGDSWRLAALYCLIGGIVGAVPAIITGYTDYSLCQTKAAAKVATNHFYLNITVTVLMVVSVAFRFWSQTAFGLVPVFISLSGVILAGLSGWLGGELVVRHGIGVHDDAVKKERASGG